MLIGLREKQPDAILVRHIGTHGQVEETARKLGKMSDQQSLDPRVAQGIDKVLAVQRPVVLAHIRRVRRRHPDATPAQLVAILERDYLTAVTTGGAAVGASAVAPAIGTGASFALTGVETIGFLEVSALFAQSVTEVHGIAVEDPQRARALVMTMLLGTAGSDLVHQLTGQLYGTAPDHNRFWGQVITAGVPQFALGPINDRIKRSFMKFFVARLGRTALGRAIPFGVGAVLGGTGNHMLGRKVVASARDAFGPAPVVFPAILDPKAVRPEFDDAVIRRRMSPLALLPGRKKPQAALKAEAPADDLASGS
jgi:hypothetical protein